MWWFGDVVKWCVVLLCGDILVMRWCGNVWCLWWYYDGGDGGGGGDGDGDGGGDVVFDFLHCHIFRITEEFRRLMFFS